ncbi:MAG: gluconate 2-dehydrogenase subunit 3 family protein [Novosphingobium sp.]
MASLAGLLGVAALPLEALAANPGASLPAPQMAVASAYADTLIPRTDTPGAVDAGVPASFAGMMQRWAAPATRSTMLTEVDAIDAAARTATGKSFAALSAAQRLAFLKPYDAANFARPAYKRLRDLMLVLYYNSEPGATVELRYEHAPGPLEPSLPITPATRASAGLSFF